MKIVCTCVTFHLSSFSFLFVLTFLPKNIKRYLILIVVYDISVLIVESSFVIQSYVNWNKVNAFFGAQFIIHNLWDALGMYSTLSMITTGILFARLISFFISQMWHLFWQPMSTIKDCFLFSHSWCMLKININLYLPNQNLSFYVYLFVKIKKVVVKVSMHIATLYQILKLHA